MNTDNSFFFCNFFFRSKTEIFCVKISTSTKIGFAPTFKMHDAEELYDLGVVITSSPDVIFKARKEASSASVALQTPMLYLFPI